jgi:hypothetical protein
MDKSGREWNYYVDVLALFYMKSKTECYRNLTFANNAAEHGVSRDDN